MRKINKCRYKISPHSWRICARGSISWGGVFDLATKANKIEQLEQLSHQPEFWDNPNAAQKTIKELTRLRDQASGWERITQRLNDALELAGLEDDELLPGLTNELAIVEKAVDRQEFDLLFADRYDDADAILAIHAGAGGTEAQDWAAMLRRMFFRWADTHGFKVDGN